MPAYVQRREYPAQGDDLAIRIEAQCSSKKKRREHSGHIMKLSSASNSLDHREWKQIYNIEQQKSLLEMDKYVYSWLQAGQDNIKLILFKWQIVL